MAYHHHQSSYEIGNRELLPQERLVVSTREGPKEPRRVAKHFGVSRDQPKAMIKHTEFINGEYLPTFQSRNCLSTPQFQNYLQNYGSQENPIFGQGLKGKTVYIVHTWSNRLTPQDLVKRVELIADTAKYNGAEAVVLMAYTLDFTAQERGTHDYDHPRMQTRDAKFKFDGQAPTLTSQLKAYLNAGVDHIITPHAHAPNDVTQICQDLNEEYAPMHRQSSQINSTRRYKITSHNIDVSPMVGLYVSDWGTKHLQFNLENNGENILFLAPDQGAQEFVRKVREHSGLTNSAVAFMDKKRSEDGKSIESLILCGQEGLNEQRGIEGMYIFLVDDMIRTGETMRKNIEVLRGMQQAGLARDPMIKGMPNRVAIYATRTNFSGGAVNVLSSVAINDIVITNADPRGFTNLGELDRKTQMLWINFLMAESAKAVERGIDPNDVITPAYLREKQLLRVEIPHGHERFGETPLEVELL